MLLNLIFTKMDGYSGQEEKQLGEQIRDFLEAVDCLVVFHDLMTHERYSIYTSCDVYEKPVHC